jgi:Polyketide cyclase / dehydrase and lipid transport
MIGSQLDHTFTIAASPGTVFAHLADPANYVGLSPLVVAVRDIRRAGDTVHYHAVERFRILGKLSYDNVIAVTLVAKRDGLPHAEITGDVHSPGGVRMAYRFSIAPDGHGAAVTDTLWLRAPFGLRRFARSRARAVQLARARILTQRLTAHAPS